MRFQQPFLLCLGSAQTANPGPAGSICPGDSPSLAVTSVAQGTSTEKRCLHRPRPLWSPQASAPLSPPFWFAGSTFIVTLGWVFEIFLLDGTGLDSHPARSQGKGRENSPGQSSPQTWPSVIALFCEWPRWSVALCTWPLEGWLSP